MTDHQTLPSAPSLKAQAKRLRQSLAEQRISMSHSEALELLARQMGYRNWNTLHAAADRETARRRFAIGDGVRGAYLGKAFSGRINSVRALANGYHRLTIVFEKPVDVVRFDSFSSLRTRVTCTVDAKGVTAQKLSDGTPHLRLDA